MFCTHGTPKTFDDHFDMSIGDAKGWYEFKGGAFVFNLVMIGDEDAGPVISLLNAAPHSTLPVSPAHAHASDSFRTAVKGCIYMDPDVYGLGEFRFQEGWRVYPGHGEVSYGSEGQWEIVVLGDRRGQKMRPAIPFEPNPENELLKSIARELGTAGDVMSDDPVMGAGPSAIASTLAPKPRMGKLTGSYANSRDWDEVAPGVRASISVIGDPVRGPLIVLTDVQANRQAMSRSRFGTELARIVIAGSCRIGERIYQQGDVRIQRPHHWCDPVEALDSGLREVIVVGDRRHVDLQTESGAWPASIPRYLETLLKALADRAPQGRAAA